MRTEIHKKIKNHRGKCLNLYHWQCAFQRKQLFAARKSSENSLLSLWRTLLCRGSFQQTELRGPGDPPWIVRTKENPKTFKKGGFLCNKDIFLKQNRGLVSWAWNLWQFFLHQDVHHLLVTFPASDVAMRIANFPAARGSSWKPGGRNIPSSATSWMLKMGGNDDMYSIRKHLEDDFPVLKNKEKNHTKFV